MYFVKKTHNYTSVEAAFVNQKYTEHKLTQFCTGRTISPYLFIQIALGELLIYNDAMFA